MKTPAALPYSVVERVVLSMHALDEGGTAALLSRFRYLQRIGFPAAKVGRGRKVAYRLDELLQIGLAFELLQVGIQPVRAARLVRTGWPDFRRVLADALRGDRRCRILALFPHALDELSPDADLQDAPVCDPMGLIERDQVGAWLAGAPGMSDSCLIIDPVRLASRLRSALVEAFGPAAEAEAQIARLLAAAHE